MTDRSRIDPEQVPAMERFHECRRAFWWPASERTPDGAS